MMAHFKDLAPKPMDIKDTISILYGDRDKPLELKIKFAGSNPVFGTSDWELEVPGAWAIVKAICSGLYNDHIAKHEAVWITQANFDYTVRVMLADMTSTITFQPHDGAFGFNLYLENFCEIVHCDAIGRIHRQVIEPDATAIVYIFKLMNRIAVTSYIDHYGILERSKPNPIARRFMLRLSILQHTDQYMCYDYRYGDSVITISTKRLNAQQPDRVNVPVKCAWRFENAVNSIYRMHDRNTEVRTIGSFDRQGRWLYEIRTKSLTGPTPAQLIVRSSDKSGKNQEASFNLSESMNLVFYDYDNYIHSEIIIDGDIRALGVFAKFMRYSSRRVQCTKR